MAGAITDKFSRTFNAVNPNVAKVLTARGPGVTDLVCDNLAGWPTSSSTAVQFSTYRPDTNNKVIAGTQTDWVGLVSGNTINSIQRVAGATDSGNLVNDIVEMGPTAKWADNLVQGILTHADNDGTLASGAVDNAAVLASNVVTTAKIADANVTTAKIADNNITFAKLLSTIFSGQVTSTTNAGSAGGSINYINLGGIKFAWGITAAQSSGNPFNAYTVILPSSFFSSIQSVTATPAAMTAVTQQQVNVAAFSTSTITFYFITTTAATTQAGWFVIGS